MIRSVDRAFAILEYMSNRKSVSVTEVATEFELDKGTVSRMMKTFETRGMAVKSETSAKYRIGSGVLRLGHNVITCNSIVYTARPILGELADKLGTTARLCMIEGKRVFVIDQIESTKSKTDKESDIPGISKPLYCSAIGKIIFAYMSPKKLEATLRDMEFIPYTENTITSEEALKKELKEIKEQGYALNIAEFSDRAYCVAVPIFCGADSEVKYCIGITGNKDYRQDRERFQEIISYMKKASQTIGHSYMINQAY